MSKEPNMNHGQDVLEGQSSSQPLTSDNGNLNFQAPVIPANHVQYPQGRPFSQWLSTPSNNQSNHHQNLCSTFLGPTPSQNPPYYQQHYQPTSSQNPPYYQHHSNPSYSQNPPYLQQNYQPTPTQNSPYHQQNSHSHPIFFSQHNSNTYQPAYQTPPTNVASTGGGKTWTSEEDLQLCRAWVKVLEDAAIGVGQTKDKLWDRVKNMFHKLMNEVYEKESVRNTGACENRIRDLNGACSKWAGIRTKVFQQPASGSNLFDSESLARQMWEDENNGKPFKHMACWNVLKECARWYDSARKSADKSTGASQPCVSATHEPVDTTSNKDKSPTPITPITEEASTGRTGGLSERGETCIPNLNGPASVDKDRPPGQKRAKGQKGQKKQRLSNAHDSTSQTFRDELMSLKESHHARWEKSRADQHIRDDRNKLALQEEMRMQAQYYALDLAKKRSDLIDDISVSAEKLVLAGKVLNELGPFSTLTPNRKLEYELRQRTVLLRKRQYAELNESLLKAEYQSLSRMEPVFVGQGAGKSQRRLDYEEEEANLPDD